MTGDKIEIKTDFTSKVFVLYRIQLKETSIETGDGSCIEYPNEKHKSYADCVEDELEERILPVLGCMVPWISRKNQCAGLIPRLPIHLDYIKVLRPINDAFWSGLAYQSDNCPQPCSTLSAHSIHTKTIANNEPKDSIFLFFDENIKVERIVPAYGFESLLVSVANSPKIRPNNSKQPEF